MGRRKDQSASKKRQEAAHTNDANDVDNADDADEVDAKPLPGEGTDEGALLRSAQAAFDRGDYAEVREVTARLVEVPNDAVAAHARDLRHRTQIDPIQVVVILACLALFSTIAYIYVLP